MPSSATITASDFYVFTAGTRIRSAQVNTNFNLWKGHILPVDPTTTVAAAASGLYDLGSPDHMWRGGHFGFLNLLLNDTSTAATTPATTTHYAVYLKSDGQLYRKNSLGVEAAVGGTGAGGGALGVTGSRASPSTITAAGGLVYNTAGSIRQLWFVTGDTTTGTTVTANPQISAGATVGAELIVVQDPNRPVVFSDGNGLDLDGDFSDGTAGLFWDGSEWSEMFRR